MNQTKIYVGNLPYQTTSEDLDEAFSAYGKIAELKLIMDRETGRSKGFAFITFEDADAAQAALQLNSTELGGRQIKVNLAKEDRGDRNDRGGRGGRGPGPGPGGPGGRRRFAGNRNGNQYEDR